jgi:hypothetical protein
VQGWCQSAMAANLGLHGSVDAATVDLNHGP